MATGTGAPVLGVATASGVGYGPNTYSRIMPGATGSIAHARILKGDRGPDAARHFHEIIKEQL